MHMLDIKLIRESPQSVKENLKKRNQNDKLKLVDELLHIDKKRRDIIKKVEDLRKQRNDATQQIASLKRKGDKKELNKILEEIKEIPERIKHLDQHLQDEDNKMREISLSLPNILDSSVPAGEGVETIKQFGSLPGFDFKVKDHMDIALELDLVDVESASKITGSRFYFLKNELLILEQSLMRFALDFLRKKNYALLYPPFFLRREAYQGVTDLGAFEETLYKIEKEDLYLIATSEHPMVAKHINEVLDKEKLPIKYGGYSTCFRKEAGSHGKDTKGIFRVHQFNKVEQVAISLPEQSWDMHQELLDNAIEFLQLLQLPFRLVVVKSFDAGNTAAKQYDLEAWFPAQQQYREVASCSNCTDYQARRLGMRFKAQGKPVEGFVHTLNSTLVADRTLVAIIENYQSERGIEVPKALRPYTGFDFIGH